MNIGGTLSFSVMVCSGYMPSSGIAQSCGSLFLVFKEISILFSIVVVSIYIPTNSARGFPFLHIFFQHLLFIDFSDDGLSDQCEVIYCCGSDLHVSNNEQYWIFFMCLLAICIASVEKQNLLFTSSHRYIDEMISPLFFSLSVCPTEHWGPGRCLLCLSIRCDFALAWLNW